MNTKSFRAGRYSPALFILPIRNYKTFGGVNMKNERLLGSYYDIVLYEHLAEKTEWGLNFYEKLVDSLSQCLKEDIEMIVLKELGGEPDEFIHDGLSGAITSANFEIIVKALLDDWLNEVIVPRVKRGGKINVI